MSNVALPFRMPMRNVPGAPVFSPDKPQTINAFFEDLEFLFTEAAISDDQIKKGHAVRYAPEPDKDLWRAFESFQAKDKSGKVQTYDDFKAEVLRLYLGKDGKRLHSLSDLNAVVITTTQSTMRSTSEFSAYSRKFRLVGDYLVKHDVLRADDRDRLFVRGLPDALRTKVLDRLKYTCPDVLAPRTPYTVQQVTDATEFVLNAQDEDIRLLYTPHALGVITTTSASTAAPPATVPARTESGQLPDMIAALTEAMRNLSHHASSTPPQSSTPASTPAARQRPPHMPDDSTTTPPRIAGCFYCGEPGHAIRACPHAETDIAAGLIARNAQGQVVLGSGQYVPKAIQGPTLRARVQEYYRIYPESRPHISNAAPTTQLLFQPVLRHPIYATQRRQEPQTDDLSDAQRDLRKERDERARKRIVRFEEPPEVARLPPVPSARIEELPDEPTISSAPHTNSPNGDASSNASNDAQRSDRIQLPGTARSATRSDPSAPQTSASANSSRRDDISIPEHPFANARDATYAPPRDRNFGAPPPKSAPPAKKGDPAYRSIAPGSSLTSYPEGRAIRRETARSLADWLFQDILCRWGTFREIVSDNGTPWVKALTHLEQQYGIKHIRISGYNSRANGAVERPHFDVRQALFKAAAGDQSKWPRHVYHVLWADRITIRRRFGCSPFFAVTGCHPILPFDIAEATYLFPPPDSPLSTADLIGARARALARRQEDLERIHSRVYEARMRAARRLEDDHAASIRDFDFKRGSIVLVRNTAIEKALNRKMRPRYLGPYVVLSRNRGGAYIVSELDGAVFDRPIAAFRLLPYLARTTIDLPWLDADDYLDISTARLREMEASVSLGDDDEDGEGAEEELGEDRLDP